MLTHPQPLFDEESLVATTYPGVDHIVNLSWSALSGDDVDHFTLVRFANGSPLTLYDGPDTSFLDTTAPAGMPDSTGADPGTYCNYLVYAYDDTDTQIADAGAIVTTPSLSLFDSTGYTSLPSLSGTTPSTMGKILTTGDDFTTTPHTSLFDPHTDISTNITYNLPDKTAILHVVDNAYTK